MVSVPIVLALPAALVLKDSVDVWPGSSMPKLTLNELMGWLKVIVSAAPEAPKAEPMVRKSTFISR